MTTLNDFSWQMLYAIKIFKNMVRRQKTVIDKVMCLETRAMLSADLPPT